MKLSIIEREDVSHRAVTTLPPPSDEPVNVHPPPLDPLPRDTTDTVRPPARSQ